MRWLGILGRWLLAVVVTTAAASAVHSWMVQTELAKLGVAIAPDLALSTAAGDLVGQGPTFGGILAISLALGFIIAALLGARLKVPAIIAYPLGGMVAVAVTLVIMQLQMHITPIAGVRQPLGFVLVSLAGGLGGLVFALTRRR